MSVVEEPGRLPGGLGVRQAVRIIARQNRSAIAMYVFAGAAVTAKAVLQLGWFGAGLLVVFAAVSLASIIRQRPGVLVTPAGQPELSALVASVATANGHRPPDRIWLRDGARISAVVPDWRRDLYLGRELVCCVTADQLRALVAHEIALLNQPRPYLMCRLVAASAEVDDQLWDPDVKPNRREHRLATRLAPTVAAAHAAADAAAARTAGREVFARALAVADAAADEYLLFVPTNTPPRRRWWRLPTAIVDVDDGFRRAVAADGDCFTWGEYTAELLAHRHPLVAAELTALGAHPLVLAPTPELLRPLLGKDQRRLARAAYHLRAGEWAHWTTFADAPAGWWQERADKGAGHVRKRATTILGRPPADDAEAVEAVHRALIETNAANPDVVEPSGRPDWLDEPAQLLGGQQEVVESAALRHGWRLVHPAVRGVLVSPTGTVLDARSLSGGTVGEPDVSRLRAGLAAIAAGSHELAAGSPSLS